MCVKTQPIDKRQLPLEVTGRELHELVARQVVYTDTSDNPDPACWLRRCVRKRPELVLNEAQHLEWVQKVKRASHDSLRLEHACPA